MLFILQFPTVLGYSAFPIPCYSVSAWVLLLVLASVFLPSYPNCTEESMEETSYPCCWVFDSWPFHWLLSWIFFLLKLAPVFACCLVSCENPWCVHHNDLKFPLRLIVPQSRPSLSLVFSSFLSVCIFLFLLYDFGWKLNFFLPIGHEMLR